MDSGASDTMFMSRNAFTEYKPITPHTGDSAKVENGNFEIVGEGNVVQRYRLMEGNMKLHIPMPSIHQH